MCLGCFTRDYPIEVQLPLDKLALERPLGMETAMVFPGEVAASEGEGDADADADADASAGTDAETEVDVESEHRTGVPA